MSTRYHRLYLSLLAGFFCLCHHLVPLHAAELLPPGFRPLPPAVHALTGARVVVKPGQVLESATVVIRDGVFAEVGTNVAIPADARVWDLKGFTLYAGFIDSYLALPVNESAPAEDSDEESGSLSLTSPSFRFFGTAGSRTDLGNPGPGYALARVSPEFRSVREYSPKEKELAPLRELGFATGLIVPAKGMIRGTSSLVLLVEENPTRTILRPDVFQHVSLETASSEDRAFPTSLMGVIAGVRQTFFDAQHYAADHAAYLVGRELADLGHIFRAAYGPDFSQAQNGV